MTGAFVALPTTQVLLSLLHSDDPNLPVPLLKALARLAADTDCAKEIRQLGGLNVVISLLSSQGTSSTLQPQVTRHQPRPCRARASLVMSLPQPPDVTAGRRGGLFRPHSACPRRRGGIAGALVVDVVDGKRAARAEPRVAAATRVLCARVADPKSKWRLFAWAAAAQGTTAKPRRP